jgi:hypothetical protein
LDLTLTNLFVVIVPTAGQQSGLVAGGVDNTLNISPASSLRLDE